jgi:hypothetical protein
MRARALPCVLLLLAVGPAADALELQSLMRELAARGDATATFEEEQHLAVLDRPLKSSGELVYRAPGHLEKRTLLPRRELLTYEAGVALVERGKRRITLDLGRYPQVLLLVESIRATLAGDQAAIERSFTVALEGDDSSWVLVLTPREGDTAALVSSIRLGGSQGTVRSMDVRQRNGDHSSMTMTPRPAQ